MKKSELFKKSKLWERWKKIEESEDIFDVAPSIKAQNAFLRQLDNGLSKELVSTLYDMHGNDMSMLAVFLNDDGSVSEHIESYQTREFNLRRLLNLASEEAISAGFVTWFPALSVEYPESTYESTAIKKLLSHYMKPSDKLFLMQRAIQYHRGTEKRTIDPFYHDIVGFLDSEQAEILLEKAEERFIQSFGYTDGMLLCLFAYSTGHIHLDEDSFFKKAQENRLWDCLEKYQWEFLILNSLYIKHELYPLEKLIENSLQHHSHIALNHTHVLFHEKTAKYIMKYGHNERIWNSFVNSFESKTQSKCTDMAFCKYIAEQCGVPLKEVRSQWKIRKEMMGLGVITSPFPFELNTVGLEEMSLVL